MRATPPPGTPTPGADLVDTWRIHVRVQRYLLEGIAPAAFDVPAPGKGRGFVAMAAHLHNVRLMWLDAAAPDLRAGLVKLDAAALDRAGLLSALEASGAAIAQLIERALETGRVKGFKPHPAAFLGYLISHEAYHHGEIGIELSRIGHPLEKKTAFGIWEWGVR